MYNNDNQDLTSKNYKSSYMHTHLKFKLNKSVKYLKVSNFYQLL